MPFYITLYFSSIFILLYLRITFFIWMPILYDFMFLNKYFDFFFFIFRMRIGYSNDTNTKKILCISCWFHLIFTIHVMIASGVFIFKNLLLESIYELIKVLNIYIIFLLDCLTAVLWIADEASGRFRMGWWVQPNFYI